MMPMSPFAICRRAPGEIKLDADAKQGAAVVVGRCPFPPHTLSVRLVFHSCGPFRAASLLDGPLGGLLGDLLGRFLDFFLGRLFGGSIAPGSRLLHRNHEIVVVVLLLLSLIRLLLIVGPVSVPVPPTELLEAADIGRPG